MRCNPWALALIAVPGIASAHTGEHGVMSVAAGLAHPFTGIDHLLAMVGIGVIAGRSSGAVRLWLPVCFLAAMACGGALAVRGLPLPMVETMIGVSVILTCTAVLASLRLPGHVSAAIVALFAVFHGHAHGAEMATNASALGYGAGYLLGTALLLGIGCVVGHLWPLRAKDATPS